MKLDVPPETLAAIADLVLARLEQHEPQVEGWIGVKEAAEHLACPRSRIYALCSAKRIPHQKDGSRLLFKRSDLDAWLEQGGGKRP